MGDAATENETDKPDDFPEARDSSVSVAHVAERLIASQMEAQQAKLAVFRAFCTAFDQTAARFTGAPTRIGKNTNNRRNQTAAAPTYAAMARKGMAQTGGSVPAHPQPQKAPPVKPPKNDLRVFVRLGDGSPAWGHQGHAIRAHVAKTLNLGIERMPQVARVKTGWAIRVSDQEARDLLIERQGDWAACLGAVTVEGFQKWHTYAVADCPRRLTDIWGAAVDYDQAFREEVRLQTGLEPVDVREAKGRAKGSDQPTVTMIVSFESAIQRR
ncbi:ribonuclease H-like protein [Hirsutella rhossiliensis]